MELGAEAAEPRARELRTPRALGLSPAQPPRSRRWGSGSAPAAGMEMRRGGHGERGLGETGMERGSMGERGWGGRNVNPSLGVSVWQVFMPLCSEHLHYALNT